MFPVQIFRQVRYELYKILKLGKENKSILIHGYKQTYIFSRNHSFGFKMTLLTLKLVRPSFWNGFSESSTTLDLNQ